MAIYHCSISNVSRAKGSSSCATLAYISGRPIKEEWTGNIYKYGRQDRIVCGGTVLPKQAPKNYFDPSVLFNAIESFEKSDNARTAKKIEVAFPVELTQKERQEAVEHYIKINLAKEGYPAVYAIHQDKDDKNPHAHILVVNRQINEKGEWNTKSRKEYALDERGERIPQLDENGNQKLGKRNEKLWKRVSVKVNPLDKKEYLQQLRESWSQECNKYLDQDHQIDHRSYEERGIDRVPTVHVGVAQQAMKEKGKNLDYDKTAINVEIKRSNFFWQQFKQTYESIRERVKEAYEKLRMSARDFGYTDGAGEIAYGTQRTTERNRELEGLVREAGRADTEIERTDSEVDRAGKRLGISELFTGASTRRLREERKRAEKEKEAREREKEEAIAWARAYYAGQDIGHGNDWER